MRRGILAVLVLVAFLVTALPAFAAEHEAPERSNPLVDVLVFLQLLGDAFEAACIGSGYEYYRRDYHQYGNGGQWHCTGVPRRPTAGE